jgi:hypothetical protein
LTTLTDFGEDWGNDSKQKFTICSNHSYLARILADLTVDSSKNRAKRDKKLQKLTFRQISDAICNDRWPQMQVHFNKRETLNLHGCHDKLLYDSLCQLLHSDMNCHLTNNGVLRELFDLGNALETMEEPLKLSKAQKVERVSTFRHFNSNNATSSLSSPSSVCRRSR